MPADIFARKPLQPAMTDAANAIPRVLTARNLTALGVSGIIGTGIFIMTGIAAHTMAGPALIISFIIAAIACASVSLCYAEFASMVPVAGSAYSYAYVALGELPGWLVGWNLVFQYGLAAASIAQGWSHYFQDLLRSVHITLPAAISSPAIDMDQKTGAMLHPGTIDLTVVCAVLIMTWVVVRGIRTGVLFNNIMLAIKLVVIAFVVIAGAAYVHPANWAPFAPYGWGGLRIAGHTFGSIGAHGDPVGVVAGAAMVFYAYMGFEAITNYTEEAKRPQRDLPIGILSAVGICTLLYMAVTMVLTGMVRYDRIDMNAPISAAFGQVGLPWARLLVSLGATIAITSVLFIIMMCLPRLVMAIGRDGLLPKGLADLHSRYKTPWKAAWICAIVVALMGSLLPLGIVMPLVILSTLGGYVVVCGAVLILRRSAAVPAGAFRAPLGPVAPIMGILSSIILMCALPSFAWMGMAVWLLIGAAIYAVYGRTHSELQAETRDAVGGVSVQPVE
jgi:APA family basic amino acid/polyamine antiporter